MLGGVSVALTRGSSKRETLLAAGAQHVIATSEQDLVAEVRGSPTARAPASPSTRSEGRGAEDLDALSHLGIFFQYGALDVADVPVPVLSLLGKNLTIRGYQLFEITTDPERLEKAKAFIVGGLASGALKPVIARTFKLDEIVEATRFMESNEQVGKIVVTV